MKRAPAGALDGARLARSIPDHDTAHATVRTVLLRKGQHRPGRLDVRAEVALDAHRAPVRHRPWKHPVGERIGDVSKGEHDDDAATGTQGGLDILGRLFEVRECGVVHHVRAPDDIRGRPEARGLAGAGATGREDGKRTCTGGHGRRQNLTERRAGQLLRREVQGAGVQSPLLPCHEESLRQLLGQIGVRDHAEALSVCAQHPQWIATDLSNESGLDEPLGIRQPRATAERHPARQAARHTRSVRSAIVISVHQ